MSLILRNSRDQCRSHEGNMASQVIKQQEDWRNICEVHKTVLSTLLPSLSLFLWLYACILTLLACKPVKHEKARSNESYEARSRKHVLPSRPSRISNLTGHQVELRIHPRSRSRPTGYCELSKAALIHSEQCEHQPPFVLVLSLHFLARLN